MRDARSKELQARCPPLAAALGRQAGGGAHVTLKQRGKTRTVYVPKDLTEEIKASIQEQRRLKTLRREITQLQLALIRSHKTGWPAWHLILVESSRCYRRRSKVSPPRARSASAPGSGLT
jgi:hypothetical protein